MHLAGDRSCVLALGRQVESLQEGLEGAGEYLLAGLCLLDDVLGCAEDSAPLASDFCCLFAFALLQASSGGVALG